MSPICDDMSVHAAVRPLGERAESIGIPARCASANPGGLIDLDVLSKAEGSATGHLGDRPIRGRAANGMVRSLGLSPPDRRIVAPDRAGKAGGPGILSESTLPGSARDHRSVVDVADRVKGARAPGAAAPAVQLAVAIDEMAVRCVVGKVRA